MKYTHTIHLRFSRSHSDIKDHGAIAGRNMGRDRDWIPEFFDEALYEILLAGWDGEVSGVHIRTPAERRDNDYLIRINWHIPDSPSDLEDLFRDFDPEGRDLDMALTRLFGSEAAALDYNVEVIEMQQDRNVSAHAAIDELRRFRAATLED